MEMKPRTDQAGETNTKKPYERPTVKKHENLKEITLLSFTPPTS